MQTRAAQPSQRARSWPWRRCWPSSSSFYPPATAQSNSPPATPSSVTLTRADGTVTASGYAVAGAAKYHVTYSSNNGQSWSAAAVPNDNFAGSSITFNADNAKSYIVGVRAGNTHGWSGWRNSPSAVPFTPDPTPTPKPQPPDTPASVTLTRADGTVTASWPAVANADTYHVTYTDNKGQSWSLAALNHTATSIDINVDNAKTYIVGVRAKNDAGGSGWRNSPSIGPYQPDPTPTPTPTPTPEPELPAAPSGLAAAGGDGSVTVSWTAPGDSTITGYQYRFRYAGVSWSAWTAVADSGADTTSFTRSGLTNGTEYRFKVRAVNAAGAGNVAPNAVPWYVAATPVAPEPPGAPTSVTVTRSDGAITASWPAVDGATGYTVTYSAVGNGDWATAASNQAGNSITINGVNNDHTYLVGASALNSAGQSARSVSPPAGPYSQKAPLAPPSVTIIRADGTLTAFWNSGYGAESYHVTYTADHGKTWSLAALHHPVSNGTTEIDIKNVDNSKHYTVAARARNKNGYSGWRNSVPAKPYIPINPPPKPKNVLAYSSDRAVTFTWDKPVDLKNTMVTGYQAASWENPGACAWPDTVPWYNIQGSSGDTMYHTVTKLKNGVKYGVALRALNQHVPGPAVAGCRTPVAGVEPPPFVPPAPTNLTVTRGDGTLTVVWHHADTAINYDVRYSVDGGQSWSYAVFYNTTTSIIMRGMDNTANYMVGVRARNERGEGPWANSEVIGLTVSNLAQANYAYDCPVASNRKCAVAFATGGAANGYTLTAITAAFANQSDAYGQLGDVVATLHAADAQDPPHPASATLATLSGDNPDTAGNYTYSCSGNGCALSGDTTYFVQFAAASGSFSNAFYNLKATTSDAETLVPGDNGWSLANVMSTYNNSGWSHPSTGQTGRVRIAALTKPALTAINIGVTSATLSIIGHGGQWWYQADKAPDNSCRGPVKRSQSKVLTGLSASTTYTYTAYRDSGCATALDTETFTTAPTPGSRDSGKDFNTLAAAGNNAPSGIWSDGTTMWVQDTGDPKAYAYNLTTKARDSGKDVSFSDTNNAYPTAMGSDGTTMWSADVITTDKLFAYTISGNTRDTSKDITLHADNRDVDGLWANSTTIWVGDWGDDYIYAYTISGGARDSGKEIDLHADNVNVHGLWSDGVTMWAADSATDKLYAYRMSDGSRDPGKDYNLDSANGDPYGIWSDGTMMWVADNGDDKLYAYHAIK